MSPYAVQVVTATLPGRRQWFEECKRHVDAQVYPVSYIVIDDREDHGDHGIAAFGRGCAQSSAPWLYCTADDEWLAPDCIAACMRAALEQDADFAVHYRQWPQGIQYAGHPPEQWNLTLGLFKRELLSIFGWGDNVWPSGGDGVMAKRWLNGGAKLAVVPRVLSRNVNA